MVFYSFALLAVELSVIELSVILASVLPFYLLLKNFNFKSILFHATDDAASSFELGFGILNVLNTDIQVCL